MKTLRFTTPQPNTENFETQNNTTMTKEEIAQEIQNADRLYYTTGNSPYSDRQYDNLKAALAEMDPDHPLLSSLGMDHVDGFKKVRHERRMLSLEKIHAVDTEGMEKSHEFSKYGDLVPWLLRNIIGDSVKSRYAKACALAEKDNGAAIAQLLAQCGPQCGVSVEPKVDGMSAEALYIDGRLKCISTRGNGDEGDDITANVKHLFPEKIDLGNEATFSKKFVIRGELYISKGEFARINAEQEKKGLEPFANPRNLCAGTVKCLEGLQGRTVSFVAHDYISLANPEPESAVKTTTVRLQKLRQYGIDSITDYGNPMLLSLYSATIEVDNIDEQRENYPFIIDGAVIKITDILRRQDLGETDHHPKWAVAFKYLPERVETVVEDITWQLGGKTGKCTPVGEIKPVIIDGTVVSRVSLGNAGLMAYRGIWCGCRVLIEKSGEIIPYVRKVLDPKVVILPEMMLCPSCGAEMKLERGKTAHTANYMCPNKVCRDKVKAALCSAYGTSGLNILGYGPETADLFLENNVKLDPENTSLVPTVMCGVWQERAAYPEALKGKAGDNLYSEMVKARTAPLHRWLAGLQIEGLAMGSAKKIAQKFKDLKSVIAGIDSEELLGCLTKKAALPNLKEALKEVVDFCDENGIADQFNPMSEHYIDPDWSDTTSKLGGKSFVVTGRFRTGRSVIENMVAANGGVLRTSVSKKTDYLVAGMDVGATKTNKAAASGTQVITEEEFLTMCQ